MFYSNCHLSMVSKGICILKANITVEAANAPSILSTLFYVHHLHQAVPFPSAFAIPSAWLALPHFLHMIGFISSSKPQREPYPEIILPT